MCPRWACATDAPDGLCPRRPDPPRYQPIPCSAVVGDVATAAAAAAAASASDDSVRHRCVTADRVVGAADCGGAADAGGCGADVWHCRSARG